MPLYDVTVYYQTSRVYRVLADNEQEAVNKAWTRIDDHPDTVRVDLVKEIT